MMTPQQLKDIEDCDEYSLRHHLSDINQLVEEYKAQRALLEQLKSARPLLLYGGGWIEWIEKVLA